MLAHQPGDAGNELRQRRLGRMGVDEQGRATQVRGNRGDAVVAQRQAQLGGPAEPGRQAEQVHRRGRQLGVKAAPEQLVGNDPAIAGVHDGLHRRRQSLAIEQGEELRLVGDEVLAERGAERGDHGPFLGRQDAVTRGVGAADAELGAADVDDVALVEQARRVHLRPVDEAPVGAAEVEEHQLAAARIQFQGRMAAAHTRGDQYHAVFLVAADAEGQGLHTASDEPSAAIRSSHQAAFALIVAGSMTGSGRRDRDLADLRLPLPRPGVVHGGAVRIHRHRHRHVLDLELVDRFHAEVGEAHDPGLP